MLDRLLISSSARKDPNFRNVTLLLHGDGSNGAQNNTFLDSSSNNFTVTRNGNTTQGSFNPYGSRWSNYFDGTGDYLSIADNAAFDVGSGNFTVEAWVWNNGSSTTSWVFGQTSSSFTASSTAVGLSVNSSGFPNGVVAVGSSFTDTVSSVAIARNSWNHIAFVRDGATLRMFVNGTQTATSNISTNTVNNSTTPVGIGRIGDYNLEYWNGYISDFRFVKGTAVYTANFTPPTAPLTAITNTSLLTCQSNRFRDASANNFAITRNGDVRVTPFSPYAPSSAYSAAANGGSIYFDNNGDSLSTPNSTALDFGTGDFTLECWVYLTQYNSATYQPVFANGYLFYLGGTGQVILYDGSTNVVLGAAGDVPVGSWNHVAWVRSGSATNNTKIYVNGVLKAQGTATGSIGSGNPNLIGQHSTVYFPGFIANLRAVKGTAVYTAAFTPPSSPVTAISGTSLLLNGTNAAIFDSAADNNLETVGNAQISTSVKKFGTGSIYIPTGCLFIPNSTELTLGSGDWTVEFFSYNDTSGTRVYFDAWNAAVSQLQMEIYSSGTNLYWVKQGGSVAITANSALTANTWQHIAACKSGGSTRLFVNGTQVGSTYTDAENYSSSRWEIGRANGQFPINGYIDEFRVTRAARYTANFTPPAAPFPDQ